MPVHIRDDRLKLTTMAFEARYEDGYRYLDHCGDTINRIRGRDRNWVVTTNSLALPHGTAMRNARLGLALSFGIERFNISGLGESMLSEASPKVERLGEEAEALYQLVMSGIRVQSASRIGVRYRITAPSDALEEADRFVSRGLKSALATQILALTGSELRDGVASYVVDDLEQGYRRRISIDSEVTMKEGDPAYTGLNSVGEAAVGVDVDTYTRPESGHLQKANLFVQNNFDRSRAFALGVIQWLSQQR